MQHKIQGSYFSEQMMGDYNDQIIIGSYYASATKGTYHNVINAAFIGSSSCKLIFMNTSTHF